MQTAELSKRPNQRLRQTYRFSGPSLETSWKARHRTGLPHSLEKPTGADAHCQVNNLLHLTQEACGWLDEIFDASGR